MVVLRVRVRKRERDREGDRERKDNCGDIQCVKKDYVKRETL